MQLDNLPTWLVAPIVAATGIWCLYRFYIEPGYAKDRASKDTQNGTL